MVKVKGKKSTSVMPLPLKLRLVGVILAVVLIFLAYGSFHGSPSSDAATTSVSSLRTTTTSNDHKKNTSKISTSDIISTAVHKLSNFSGETVSLRTSVMPALGYGTCCRQSAKGEAIYKSTLTYLKLGGRLIDTAMAYGNHVDIGRAVRDSGVARDEVWITSKISPNIVKKGKGNNVYKKTVGAIETILQELNLPGSYLDLCLIHSPKLGKEATLEIWKALVEAQQSTKKVKSIGVSNFNKQEILDLQSATGVSPEVNQIQYHPWTSVEWKALVRWQQETGIVTTAYNSLGGSKFHTKNDGWSSAQELSALAQRQDMTEAQLLLRWALQQKKVAVIPGATSEAHIRENLSVPPTTADLDGALTRTGVPANWFDAKRGPTKYKADAAEGRGWTGDHTLPKKQH